MAGIRIQTLRPEALTQARKLHLCRMATAMGDFRFSRKYGLWIPETHPTDQGKIAHTDLDAAAEGIRAIYKASGVLIDSQSGLGRMLAEAEAAKNRNPDSLISSRSFFDALSAIEVHAAVSAIERHPRAEEYLRRLVRGKLSSYDAGPSIAKDTLWELDVCSRMRQAGLLAEIGEPDIIWNDGTEIGIACKKVYSNARLQAALSKAASQVANTKRPGLVAIDITELLPRGKTLRVNNSNHVDDRPLALIRDFADRHSRHFLRYFHRGTISAAIITCTCRVNWSQLNGRTGLFFTRPWWTWAPIESEDASRVRRLINALNALAKTTASPSVS